MLDSYLPTSMTMTPDRRFSFDLSRLFTSNAFPMQDGMGVSLAFAGSGDAAEFSLRLQRCPYPMSGSGAAVQMTAADTAAEDLKLEVGMAVPLQASCGKATGAAVTRARTLPKGCNATTGAHMSLAAEQEA